VFGTRLIIMPGERALAAVRDVTTQTKEASALLTKVFDQNNSEDDKDLLRITEVSNLCNAMVRQNAERLKHSFASSFDREDIYALVLGMSTIVHQLEMLAITVRRCQLRQYPPEMIGLAGGIRSIVLEFDELAPLLNRPKELQRRLPGARRLQEESQELSEEAVGKLFRSGLGVTDTVMYKDLYDHFDAVLERCQYVVSIMERISIKQG